MATTYTVKVRTTHAIPMFFTKEFPDISHARAFVVTERAKGSKVRIKPPLEAVRDVSPTRSKPSPSIPRLVACSVCWGPHSEAESCPKETIKAYVESFFNETEQELELPPGYLKQAVISFRRKMI